MFDVGTYDTNDPNSKAVVTAIAIKSTGNKYLIGYLDQMRGNVQWFIPCMWSTSGYVSSPVSEGVDMTKHRLVEPKSEGQKLYESCNSGEKQIINQIAKTDEGRVSNFRKVQTLVTLLPATTSRDENKARLILEYASAL